METWDQILARERRGRQKARRRMAHRFGVNIFARIWIRSQRLLDIKTWYLRRKALSSSRKYRPLSDGMIRLLRIQPGHAMNTIECVFSYAHLSSAGDYAALSYTWGQNAPSVPILINGSVTLVSENLYLALLHLRKRTVTTLWVDGICINQDDIAERAKQVGCMKDIYERAAIVFIWLGESNKLSERGFNELQNLTTLLDWDDAVSHREFDQDRMKQDPNKWRAISDVLYRPWFRRLWVIQEALSARKALMVCGKDALDLDLFLKLINSMIKAEALRRVMRHHPSGHEVSEGTMQVAFSQLQFLVKASYESIYLFAEHKFRSTLLNYLAETRWAEATDPRDRVFGILSLAGDSRSLGHWNTEKETFPRWIPFKPDYTLSKEEVFIDATKAILCSTGSLEVLRFARYTFGKSNRLPSWVPDWSSKEPHDVPDYQTLGPSSEKREPYWRSTRTTSATTLNTSPIRSEITWYCGPSYSFGSRNTLIVKGFQFDTIKVVSRHAHPDMNILSFFDSYSKDEMKPLDQMQRVLENSYQWIEECIPLAAQCHPYPTGENIWTSLWSTLNGDSTQESEITLDIGDKLLEHKRRVQSKFTALKKHLMPGQAVPPGPLSEFAMKAALSNLEYSVSQLPSIGRSCYSKQFAVTRGRYMGLVPDVARAGDIVCVFYGCEMPVILRRYGRKDYRFIGHCKIQGFDFDDAVVESSLVHRKRGKRKKGDFDFSIYNENMKRKVYVALKKTRHFTLV
ncbi:heterokaryon incompatibility protein-domain-containing protein [Lophiotrema nucula]|uniref:Heterokaryon incompatibility protein-domain-containing protein n=1 Tax=Lophiotrema nucula TaxID=690887 RepID=A0A6A5ZJR6_9PLEO|nr:heterokaryon incompatibility protein-domain-containing protein [Lophiotrema nucula]